MTGFPAVRDLAELVRLPAALSVPGDAWSGSAWAGTRPTGAAGLMPLGSVLLYWSGMALNDWADREVDADERPERVIPTGRVTAGTALAVAGVLGAAGIAVSAAAGGRTALRFSVPLALLVATYDVVAKDSAAGPLVMASTRGLDVLLGAAAAPGAAAVPAAAVAVHTAGVTLLSRGEVHGTSAGPAIAALGATATATGVLVATTWRDAEARTIHRCAAVGFAALYAGAVGSAQARALADPAAARVRAATGAGIGGPHAPPGRLARRSGAAPDRDHRRGCRSRLPQGRPGGEPDMTVRLGYGLNGFAGHRLADACAVVSSIGYEGVGLTLDQPHLDPFGDLPSQVAHARRCLEAHGLASVVETGSRYVLDPWHKHEPTFVSDDGRDRRIELLRRAVRIAHELGSEAVSCWSGTAPAGVGAAVLWRRVVDGIGRTLDEAARLGVTVCVEPEPGMFLATLDDVLALRASARSPRAPPGDPRPGAPGLQRDSHARRHRAARRAAARQRAGRRHGPRRARAPRARDR